MPAPEADEDLMDAIAGGDARAFAVLLERHTQKVRAIGWRMLGSAAAADDIAQDVFLRIWKNPRGFDRKKGRFSTWLHRVAETLVSAAPDPEEEAIRAGRARRVRAAIGKLPERQRLAITLAHDMGHTNIEIAQVMETSVEAVESLLGRARRKLKELLAGEMREFGAKGERR